MSEDDQTFMNFSLAGGYNNGGGGYAQANFQDAEETQPPGVFMESLGGNSNAVSGIVHQVLQRHISEVVPAATSPQLQAMSLQGTNNWRKRLREMMVKQDESFMSFLLKPPASHSLVGPAEQALRRYAIRQDVDNSHVRTLRELVNDISGAQMLEAEIETRIQQHGPATLAQLRKQTMALLELYKETGERLLETENQLKLRLDKMDSVQQQVSIVLALRTNDSTPALLSALEDYLKTSFADMTIEPLYKELLLLYQKHMALRQAIQLYRVLDSVQSEPSCGICLTDSVSCAINPCGHTFCGTCARRMTVECGICRGRIRDRMKIYFS